MRVSKMNERNIIWRYNGMDILFISFYFITGIECGCGEVERGDGCNLGGKE